MAAVVSHSYRENATMLALVARIGGPADVAAAPEKARALLRGMSHGLMAPERIDPGTPSGWNSTANSAQNSRGGHLKLAPPLTIEERVIDRLLETLTHRIRSVSDRIRKAS